ncbi:MAG: hypothetical protein GC162_15790 [Planctomycetes bacterium]|nr:hypothetical protein [Planctomycetota bacterium]
MFPLRSFGCVVVVCLFLVSSAVQAAVSTAGLAAYYTYETDLNDVSGNNVNPVNSPTGFISGTSVFDNAYQDDDDSSVDLGSALAVGTNNFTVAGWVRGNWDVLSTTAVLVGNKLDGTDVGWGLVRWDNANFLFFIRTANMASEVAAGQTFGLDFSGTQWMFLALIIDQTAGTATQFGGWQDGVTGVSFQTASITPGSLDGSTYNGGHTGMGIYGSGSLLYDEWSFWNRALTHDEILELYNGGAGQQLNLIQSVPEPMSLGLWLIAGAGLIGRRRS